MPASLFISHSRCTDSLQTEARFVSTKANGGRTVEATPHRTSSNLNCGVTGSALSWTRLKRCLRLELDKQCGDAVVTSQRDGPNELEITRTAARHATVQQTAVIKGWSQIDEQYDYTPKAESH